VGVLSFEQTAERPNQSSGALWECADGVCVLQANEHPGGGDAVTSDNPRVKAVRKLNGDHEMHMKGLIV
jgi:hypothetical protein